MSQLYVKSDTDYPEKISKKSKILNMPKKAPNGPNSFYFCIFGLKMSQLYVKSDNDYKEKISKKSKILNMPIKMQNGQN